MKKFSVIIKFSLIFFIIFPYSLKGQNDKGEISFSETHRMSLSDYLDLISSQSGYFFSYNPDKIPLDTILKIEPEYSDIKESLELLKKFGLVYTIIEDHIILKYRPAKVFIDETKQVDYTISGYVKDKSTGEVLIGATISTEEGARGTITNAYGFYSLTLPEGRHRLMVSYISYKRDSASIEIGGNEFLDFRLEPATAGIGEVIVLSSPTDAEDLRKGNRKFRVNSVSLKSMPGFMGENDVVKSLQTLPGINFYSDGSTLFHVRGGDRDQNLILIDEAPVYNPAHMLGIFSVFTPECLNSVNVYKADMPASYGGRLSSVIDIRMKEGNNRNITFSGNTGPVATTLNLEGPVFRKKSSFLISARRSHLKWLLGKQVPDLTKLYFSDFNLKYNLRINPRNRIYFSFYAGKDLFRNYEKRFRSNGLSWQNMAGTVRWNHVFGARLFSNTSLIVSNYNYNLYTSYELNQRWHSGISLFALKSDFSFYMNPQNKILFGLKVAGHNYAPGNFLSGNDGKIMVKGVTEKNTSESVIYIDHELQPHENLSLRYGFRISSWNNRGPAIEYSFDEGNRVSDTLIYGNSSYNNYTTIEPRLGMTYVISPEVGINFSYSRNVQFEYLLSNSISPFTSLEIWLPAGPNMKPMKSDQVVAGINYNSSGGSFSASAEVFSKFMNNYISYADHAYMIFNPFVENQLRFGTGRSYGTEFLFRKNLGNFTGWLSYTWSRTFLQISGINNNKRYPARYDRPHSLGIYLDYRLNPRIKFSANWIYASGSPFTTPVSWYYYQGYQLPYYSERNNDRLPDYHRLDLASEFRLNGNEAKYEHFLRISFFNLYGRKNPFTINFNKIVDEKNNLIIPMDRSEPNELQSSMLYIYGFVPSVSYHFKF